MSATSELAHLFRALKAPAAARALPKLAERARMVVDLLDAAGARERELPEHQRYGRTAPSLPRYALPIRGSAS